MKLHIGYLGIAALVAVPVLYAQSGKLPDADFRKLAQSHSTADEHHSREAAEALRALAKIHQQLAKEHTAKK